MGCGQGQCLWAWAVAVAKAIQDDVDGFCVSNIDEAIELRQAGLSKKSLILGVSDIEAVSLAKEYDITLTVWLDWNGFKYS